MHEGYSARGRLPMENGPQSIGGNGHGTGGAELWCGCHTPRDPGFFLDPADRLRPDGVDGLGDVLVVAGSDRSRQASVALGLAALGERGADTVVLVHDAARPLTPPQVTARVIDAVRAGAGAVIPVLPVSDTLKTVDASGLVTGTPRRADLAAVQTPQGFRWDVLTRAHEAGASLGADEAVAATDDAGLVEAIGVAVHTVAGDERSLKVTRPLDLALARLLADQEQAD